MTDDAQRGNLTDTGRPDAPEDEGREEREFTFSRKALLKAGWAVPVAMAVAPAAAFAASPVHNDHTDATVHVDA
jgi:hypothetical protein